MAFSKQEIIAELDRRAKEDPEQFKIDLEVLEKDPQFAEGEKIEDVPAGKLAGTFKRTPVSEQLVKRFSGISWCGCWARNQKSGY